MHSLHLTNYYIDNKSKNRKENTDTHIRDISVKHLMNL
jgi:hypothetical protein